MGEINQILAIMRPRQIKAGFMGSQCQTIRIAGVSGEKEVGFLQTFRGGQKARIISVNGFSFSTVPGHLGLAGAHLENHPAKPALHP